MTGKDTLWFGKHKGRTLEEMLSKEKGWCSWFLQETWTKDKYPDLYGFLESGGKSTTKKELDRDSIEEELMANAMSGFPEWWWAQYGKNLRAAKSDLYIPHLRIAKAAWEAAVEHGPVTLARRTLPLVPTTSHPIKNEDCVDDI